MRYNAKKMPHASLPGCLTANHIKNQYPTKSVGRPVYQFFCEIYVQFIPFKMTYLKVIFFQQILIFEFIGIT